jgi:hypothetical protein
VPKDLTLAFAGHAPNTRRNIEYLLADWLSLGTPDGEGYYDKPDRYGHITIYMLLTDGQVPAGLKPALNLAVSIEDVELHLVTDEVTGAVAEWTDSVDHVHEPDDPFEFLIGELSGIPSPYLLINWDEKDADDEQLIKLAHQSGKIKVVDLVQGLAEIRPDEEDQEPEPEPERPIRKPAKPQREEVEELDPEEEELDDTSEPVTSTPRKSAEKPQVGPTSTLEDDVAAAHREMQTTIAVGEVTVPAELLREAVYLLDRAGYFMRATDATTAAKNLADDVAYSPLTQALGDKVKELNLVLHPELDYEKTPALKATKKPAGKPTKVVWDEDAQEWKKAGRGRLRAGTRVGFMDEDGNVIEGA